MAQMEAQANAQNLQMIQELEIEMMADMYQRLTNSCHRKCIATTYTNKDISKGEAVCIDRCVAKFLEIHERIGKKLGQLSMQDESLLKK